MTEKEFLEIVKPLSANDTVNVVERLRACPGAIFRGSGKKAIYAGIYGGSHWGSPVYPPTAEALRETVTVVATFRQQQQQKEAARAISEKNRAQALDVLQKRLKPLKKQLPAGFFLDPLRHGPDPRVADLPCQPPDGSR